jgi:hypothetical protein
MRWREESYGKGITTPSWRSVERIVKKLEAVDLPYRAADGGRSRRRRPQRCPSHMRSPAHLPWLNAAVCASSRRESSRLEAKEAGSAVMRR